MRAETFFCGFLLFLSCLLFLGEANPEAVAGPDPVSNPDPDPDPFRGMIHLARPSFAVRRQYSSLPNAVRSSSSSAGRPVFKPNSARLPPKPQVKASPKLRSGVSRFRSLSKRHSKKNTDAASQKVDHQPLDSGAPPPAVEKKKTLFQKTRDAVIAGVGPGTMVASQVASTAVQIQSMRLMTEMQIPSSSSEQLGPGPSSGGASPVSYYSRKSKATEACPGALENAFISLHRQSCPSSDADFLDDSTRSFSSGDEHTDDSADDSDSSLRKSKIMWSSLKPGGGLHLKFRDYKKNKAYGQPGAYVCRREIMAVSDRRVGFVQKMAVVSLKSSQKLTDLAVNKKAALICADQRLPLSALPSGQPRGVGGSSSRGNIPEIKFKGSMQLSWRGLVWATTKVKNSCHADSFFTYVLFMCKLDPQFADRNFLISQDGYEAVLRELCKRFVAFVPQDNKIMPVKKLHEQWKSLWLVSFYPRFASDVEKGKIVDFRGSETETVGEHLERSLVYFMAYSCNCQGRDVIVRKAFFPSMTMAELIFMSRVNAKSGLEDEPLDLYLTALKECCASCALSSSSPKLNFVFVPITTWMLFFHVGKSTQVRLAYKVSDVPVVFIAHELFQASSVEFVLAYVSCSTLKTLAGVTHVVSFMRFNQKFYFYDDAKAGALVYSPNPNALQISQNLKIESVVYFRK